MSNEKDNELIDRSSSSDIDEFYEDPENEIEEPVDVRQYVISLGQAGIHGSKETQNFDVLGLVRTIQSELCRANSDKAVCGSLDSEKSEDFKRLQWYLQMSGDLLRFFFKKVESCPRALQDSQWRETIPMQTLRQEIFSKGHLHESYPYPR